MTGLVRKAALLGACGLFMASIAGAAVPDPAHSAVPAFITCVGTNSGTVDPAILEYGAGGAAFTVTVRDFLNNPISGSNVEINYSNCSDTKLCTAVIAGRTVDCTNRAVRASTNAAGQVSLTLLGGANNPGTQPYNTGIFAGAGLGCIRIYADGIQLGTATSVVFDQNGSLTGTPGNNGVNGLDLSIANNDRLAYALGFAYRGRADIDRSGTLTGLDLSVLKNEVVITPGSLNGCAGVSPNPATPQPYCP